MMMSSGHQLQSLSGVVETLTGPQSQSAASFRGHEPPPEHRRYRTSPTPPPQFGRFLGLRREPPQVLRTRADVFEACRDLWISPDGLILLLVGEHSAQTSVLLHVQTIPDLSSEP
ncbi:hypothetical protein JOB18_014862 [Solea senegalensis]|uniref:Uncharacterized protein n=1 Tax=Solea senegalensis TaxID=28829 RepID=A0AAV6RGZ9_SOLSE|nr:hypothetical protein JOB18_014862 [Solea senegalensis]